jgi:hypothetical protein
VGEESSDDWAVAAARAGDFEPLIRTLEEIIVFPEHDPTFKTLLWPDMCRVLIKILKGEIRRPKKRPPDKFVAARRFFISFEVEYLKRQGESTEDAVAHAADRFHISARLVYEERKKYPIDDGLYEKIMSDSPFGVDLFHLMADAVMADPDDTRVGGWMQHLTDLVAHHRTSSSRTC